MRRFFIFLPNIRKSREETLIVSQCYGDTNEKVDKEKFSVSADRYADPASVFNFGKRGGKFPLVYEKKEQTGAIVVREQGKNRKDRYTSVSYGSWFATQIEKNFKIIMNMVLNEINLVDKHFDVFDLRVFNNFNLICFHGFPSS